MKKPSGPGQKYAVRLTEEEKRKIEAVIRSQDSSRTVKCRAQILKLSDLGSPKRLTRHQVAMQVGVSPSTVSETVKRYALEPNIDEVLRIKHNPASDDAKRKVDGRIEAEVIRLACTKPPASRSRWTVRSLTEALAKTLDTPIAKTTVHKILSSRRLRPHKNEYYCLPPDEDADPDIRAGFINRMETVIETYERGYDPAHPVWCMDEKSLQLPEEVRHPLPAAPGRPRRTDSDYKRNGTAVMLVFVEPHTGRCFVSTRKHRRAADWAETVDYLLNVMCPDAERVTLVVDNLNIHSFRSLRNRFSPKKAEALISRLELVRTPVHGSWMNIAENQISVISRQCLTRRIPDLRTLQTAMRAWVRRRNALPHTVNWQFTKAQARRKLRHLYPACSADEAA